MLTILPDSWLSTSRWLESGPLSDEQIRQREHVGEVQEVGQRRIEQVDRVHRGRRTVGRGARREIDARSERSLRAASP